MKNKKIEPKIEFRGWNGNYWIFGFGSFKNYILMNDNNGKAKVFEKTIGIDTKMKDKDKNKIFEGDIVEVANQGKGNISYEKGCFFIKVSEKLLPLYKQKIKDLKIVGTIYDDYIKELRKNEELP